MNPEATVFVVDDEPDIQRSVAWLLESVGLRVEAFGSADAFFAAYRPERAGCLLLDVRLRGGSGFDVLTRLGGGEAPLPVIMMTAYGDFDTAVRALKAGAADIFEKPFREQELLDRIGHAIAADGVRRAARGGQRAVRESLKRLTPRERAVFERLTAGMTSKAIAAELRLSVRTVDHYRMCILRKMGATSTPQAMGMVLQAGAQAAARRPEAGHTVG